MKKNLYQGTTIDEATRSLIECYGDTAWLEAAQRSYRLLEAGELANSHFWREVVDRVHLVEIESAEKEIREVLA